MKILKRKIIKGQGFVQVMPQEEEDLWHLYNLIHEGDLIKSQTTRKIINTSVSGVKKAQIRKVTLTLKIVKISYHASDHLAIEIKGKNQTKNDFMNLNQYHTFQVHLEEPLTIIKNDWSGYHFKILKEIGDPTHDSDVAAMVMDEGIAHLCYIKTQMTLLKHKVEKSIPKKKGGASQRQTAMQKFYQMCFDAFMTTDFEQIQCFIIASPGFVKDEFLKFIKEQAQDQNSQQASLFKKHNILQKILCVRASNGYLNALGDVLQDPQVINQLQDTKAIKQIQVFDQFYKTMAQDENKVAYAEKQVIECFKQDAIQTLLISDSLFRTKDLRKRTFYNALVDNVNRKGGITYIFSSLHNSGQKLNNLSGIAAILKFPVLFDDDDEDEDEEEQQYVNKKENTYGNNEDLSGEDEEEKKDNNENENKKQKNYLYDIDIKEDDQGINDEGVDVQEDEDLDIDLNVMHDD